MTIASHLNRTIQDTKTGRLVLGAQVTICNPGTTTAISLPLYSDVALTKRLGNPFTCASGVIDVYVSRPVTVRVKTKVGASISYVDNLPILPAAENFMVSPTALTITNSPGTGLHLIGVDTQTANWGDLSAQFPDVASVVMGWFVSQSFQLDAIARNSDGAMLTADVTWPDGLPGSYVADSVSTVFPGKVDSWHVTRVTSSGTTTYQQNTVTRDSRGDITDMPLVQVT